MRKTLVLLLGGFYFPAAIAAITPVGFGGMNQGPYTFESFEGAINPGASYLANSRTRLLNHSGINRGPGFGLTSNSVQEEIFIDFANPTSLAGFWFGN